jgi:hypothetical protein
MNVTTANTIYPINMFDSQGTQSLRQQNQAKQVIPATESNQAAVLNQRNQQNAGRAGSPDTAKSGQASNSEQDTSETESSNDINELSDNDRKVVEQLKARDREVRAHEQAHARVGGQYAGAPGYDYQLGPDGRRYAVGGEVQIDISKASSPEQTVQKMEQVVASAMAPQQPSAQDVRVANQARQIAAEARSELNMQRTENTTDQDSAQASDNSPVLQQQESLMDEYVSQAVGLSEDTQVIGNTAGLASETQTVPQAVNVAVDTSSNDLNKDTGENQTTSSVIAARYGLASSATSSDFSQLA